LEPFASNGEERQIAKEIAHWTPLRFSKPLIAEAISPTQASAIHRSFLHLRSLPFTSVQINTIQMKKARNE